MNSILFLLNLIELNVLKDTILSLYLVMVVCFLFVVFILLFLRKKIICEKFKRKIRQKKIDIKKRKNKKEKLTVNDEFAMWHRGHFHKRK